MTEALEMPAGIVKRICQVKKGVKTLAKEAKNTHAGYKYVTIDQIYDMTRDLMADAGLVIMMNQRESETTTREGRNGAVAWLWMDFDVYLYSDEGERYGPVKRDIQVQATGPQAYQGAASYVEKYFMRSLFKIPTGEEDADAHEKVDLPSRAPKKAAPPPAPIVSEEESATRLIALRTLLAEAKTREDLKKLLTDSAQIRFAMWDDDKEAFKQAFRAAEDKISAANNGASNGV